MLSVTQTWHQNMEAGGSAVCVFLDLAKAFDTVPHYGVVEALPNTGVGGPLLAWFRDYLSGRSQFVAL